jgi:hypothetical protein
MPTVAVKLSKSAHHRLAEEAARRAKSESTVPRDSFDKVTGRKKITLWDRIGHLAGSIDGPGNLSALSKTLPGYGQSRSRR